jgi:hypothetical protein
MFEAPFSTPLASGTAMCTQDHVLAAHQCPGGAQLSFYIEQRTPELPTGERGGRACLVHMTGAGCV